MIISVKKCYCMDHLLPIDILAVTCHEKISSDYQRNMVDLVEMLWEPFYVFICQVCFYRCDSNVEDVCASHWSWDCTNSVRSRYSAIPSSGADKISTLINVRIIIFYVLRLHYCSYLLQSQPTTNSASWFRDPQSKSSTRGHRVIDLHDLESCPSTDTFEMRSSSHLCQDHGP